MKPKDKDFQQVKCALRIMGRAQSPPRGYFNSFSNKVLNRINSPELPLPRPWYERLGFGEDWKLGLLCILGMMVCLALAAGLVAARKVPPQEEILGGPQRDPAADIFTAPAKLASPTSPGLRPYPGLDGAAGSTTPVMVTGTATNAPTFLPLSAKGNPGKTAAP